MLLKKYIQALSFLVIKLGLDLDYLSWNSRLFSGGKWYSLWVRERKGEARFAQILTWFLLLEEVKIIFFPNSS